MPVYHDYGLCIVLSVLILSYCHAHALSQYLCLQPCCWLVAKLPSTAFFERKEVQPRLPVCDTAALQLTQHIPYTPRVHFFLSLLAHCDDMSPCSRHAQMSTQWTISSSGTALLATGAHSWRASTCQSCFHSQSQSSSRCQVCARADIWGKGQNMHYYGHQKTVTWHEATQNLLNTPPYSCNDALFTVCISNLVVKSKL